MSTKWHSEVVSNNVLQFTKGDERIFAPHLLNDRYVIKDILSAAGGFGIIYIAEDVRLFGRKVLVKARRYDKEPGLFSYAYDDKRKEKILEIRKQIQFEFNCLRKFKEKSEARMPNVNDIVYDFSPAIHGPHRDITGELFTETDRELVYGEPYIIMQMIDGENLGDLIENGVEELLEQRGYESYKFWEYEVLQYTLELCTILETFHEPDSQKNNLYFLYQDLKPENIMLTHDMFLTLIDFGGMTAVRANSKGEMVSNWKNLGSAGTGTWGYKPPEMDPKRRMLSQLDQRTDVYTLGATVYHLLTGDNPAKFADEYQQIPYENLDRFQMTNATKVLIRKATAPDRDKRYQTMNEIVRQIYSECFKDIKK